MSSKITRRSFIGSSVTIPLVGAFFWCKSPQHTQFLMPCGAWGVLASLTMLKCKNFIVDGFVSSASALVIAEVVTESWNDMPWWVDFLSNFYVQGDDFDAAQKWLTEDGWEQRLLDFLAFVRQGGFRVEQQGSMAELRTGSARLPHLFAKTWEMRKPV
jgi:hypothetical protein